MELDALDKSLQPAIPGAHVRCGVSPGPVLRQHGPGGDRGGAGGRTAIVERPGRPGRRGGAVQARARGVVRIIDLGTVRLDARSDAYLTTLPSLRLNDARIPSRMVRAHERMLIGGIFAEGFCSLNEAYKYDKELYKMTEDCLVFISYDQEG